MKKILLTLITIFCFALSFASGGNQVGVKPSKTDIVTGADQVSKYLPILKGKNVGMTINQTSTIGKKLSMDSLLSLGVKVVKGFGPEHGFRGNASDGAVIGNFKDEKTGIPIISLYGDHNKPTKEDLAGVDVMIFDIQDVGVRFYTFLSTLHYVMEACAENIIELIILVQSDPIRINDHVTIVGRLKDGR